MDSRNMIPKNSRLRRKSIGFSFFYYIWFFLTLSLTGWVWEVCLYLAVERRFVNRGVLFGPWLPIYGAGGLFLYFLLYRLKKHPLMIFFLAALICSAVEYACSWFLEKLWNIRWWDYSDYFLNLNGRVCLPAAVAFGLGALLLIYLFIPWFEQFYEKLPSRLRKTAGLVLLLLFLADAAYAAAAPNLGEDISAPVVCPSHAWKAGIRAPAICPSHAWKTNISAPALLPHSDTA